MSAQTLCWYLSYFDVLFSLQALLRSFEADIEALNKQQKQLVEKAEITQGLDLKFASKKIKQDQDREVRMFHETLKQELKLLKQEVEMMPKDQRKDALRRRREEKDIEHQERVGRIFISIELYH
jgi:polyhydroxyalkanoate synthesis regulator protein